MSAMLEFFLFLFAPSGYAAGRLLINRTGILYGRRFASTAEMMSFKEILKLVVIDHTPLGDARLECTTNHCTRTVPYCANPTLRPFLVSHQQKPSNNMQTRANAFPALTNEGQP
jgi:hypothetical protein